MPSQIFINLPVVDLQKSVSLYVAIGFTINPQFSDDTATCMVWEDSIFVMLLSHSKFLSFINKPIADTINTQAALYSISVESLARVNTIVGDAVEAGAVEPNEMRDYGFMQQRTIEDFDGHTWEFFYMDLSKLPTE